MSKYNLFDAKAVVDALLQPPYYTIVDIPIVPEYTDKLFTGFRRLLAEPEEARKLWTIHRPGLIKPDHGLIPPKGKGYDQKYFYHHSLDLPDFLKEANVPIELFKDWIIDCDTFLRMFVLLGEQIIREIDSRPEFEKFNFLKRFEEAPFMHKMRLAKYLFQVDGEENKMLAQPHCDLSTITLQFTQSHKGLKLGEVGPDAIPYEGTAGQVLIFFGRKLAEATNDLIYKMPHYVEAPEGLNEDRYSGICFIHTNHAIVEHQ